MVNAQTEADLKDLPQFKNLTAVQFKSKIETILHDYKSTLDHIKRIPQFTWSQSIQPLEEAAERLGKIWGLLEHLNSVSKTPAIRAVYEQLLPVITNFHTDVLQDVELFKRFVQYRQSAEFKKLSIAQQTIINNDIRDFNLSGVDLEAVQRNEYRGYIEALNELENRFSNNVMDATEAWFYHITPHNESKLKGLPQHTRAYAKNAAKKRKLSGWVLTLDYPCYHAIMAYGEDRELRELFYQMYNTRASSGKFDNTDVIEQILDYRRKIAQIIGYKTYAQYSLIPKTAESIQEVNNFLQELTAKVHPKAIEEYADLSQYAQQHGLQGEIEAHDYTFYEEKQLKTQFNISEEDLREYFPEPRVLNGMFRLVRQLFGLTITEINDFDRWHQSVRLFMVQDIEQKIRGYFYIDLYTRSGKQGGAWMSECASRVRFSNDFLQKPVAFLNCNFAPPSGDNPGLLSHTEVITLFHEFGHTLHHVLTKVDFFSVSGLNGVAWDAVELPSQFMEDWCWEWVVIQDISENIKTGEPLPREIFDRLVASRNYHAALKMLRQIEFSLFDMRIHEDYTQTAHEILMQVRREIGVVPTPEFNRFENSFTHIFGGGYAAGYYSYLWAELLSCAAFAKFRDNGLINSQLGRSFMTNILEQGGSRPAMELFIAFAGQRPVVDTLLRHHGII